MNCVKKKIPPRELGGIGCVKAKRFMPMARIIENFDSLKHRNCAHWRAGAAAYLERQADKAKASATDESVQVDQIFVMRKSQFAANEMDLLIRYVPHSGRHGLDPERRDLFLP